MSEAPPTPENSRAVLAIDGPVGVGKSTVARRVAERLGFFHLDTGAMYRCVALRAMKLPEEKRADGAALRRIAEQSRIDLPEPGVVLLDGEDVSEAIRSEELSAEVAIVADDPGVREVLVARQREIGLRQPAVLEGRDTGTMVFPDAALKIFLDASPASRAKRRTEQLRAAGEAADYEAVLAGLMERDRRDRARPVGALRIAAGARIVDTTNLTEDVAVSLLAAMAQDHPVFAAAAAGAARS